MVFARRIPKLNIDNLRRSFERQVDYLPTEYLRQFFRVKVGDDIQAIETSPPRRGLQIRKLKRAKQALRVLEKANAACAVNFNRMLDIAYGRKGKLKWELLTPLAYDPAAPLPERIIPAVEKSRPPVYTPELAALLTSSVSRVNKALDPKSLQRPPTLPERADPNSEQARLLGPFSKRREVNIYKRFFKNEVSRVLPPLQVMTPEQTEGQSVPDESSSAADARPIRGTGLEDTNIFEEAHAIAGQPWVPPAPTLRGGELVALPAVVSEELDVPIHTTLRQRFLRRRFQQLMWRLPILTQKPSTRAQPSATEKEPIRYVVSRSPRRLAQYRSRDNAAKYPPASEIDVAWYELAEAKNQEGPKGKKKALHGIEKQKSEG